MFFTRRFFPLFMTQFLGAFNDNLLKNALVILVTYRMAAQHDENAALFVTFAAGLFILPFFLFSATAGQLADKYDKARLTRIIKVAEILIMAIAVTGFCLQNSWVLLVALFLMGMHSTFFGPIKYALLPQHLKKEELLMGNSYIEAGTFLAILLGTMGGVFILQAGGVTIILAALPGAAIAGYLISRHIPQAPAPEPSLRINRNIWQETCRIVSYSKTDKGIFLSILGISWFWMVGATFLSQFAPYVKEALHAEAAVVTLFLAVFTAGTGIGSFLCNKLLHGFIRTAYVPVAALGITIFGVDLYFASLNVLPAAGTGLMTLHEFIAKPAGWRITVDLFMIALSGGMYVVPLYALMQQRSHVEHRARVIAANNIINALFMVASAVLTFGMLSLHFTIAQVFLSVAIANGFVAAYMGKALPNML